MTTLTPVAPTYLATLIVACGVLSSAATSAALIDNFEQEPFYLEVIDEDAGGPSAHMSVSSDSVIGGDRDVGTFAHDGLGSYVQLSTSQDSDAVQIQSNVDGTVYGVLFQYDGPGVHVYDLNADFDSSGDRAVVVTLVSASLSAPATIELAIHTGVGEPGEAAGLLTLPVAGEGPLVFPFASLTQVRGVLDFSDVDVIGVGVRLGPSSSIAISEIATTTIPEPSGCALLSCVLAAFGLRARR